MSTTINYNESDLWSSFVNGDKEAFSHFYKHNYQRLYSYAISLGMDEEQVRDIIQELFIKLYMKPQLIREVSTIRSFLFVSIKNAFINQINFKRKHVNYEYIENFELSYCVENTKLEDEEEVKRIKDKVDEIISCLTPRQKEIIYLRFLQQMEYDEIAQIMDMSEQAARNLIYRAMEKARKNNTDFTFFLFTLFLLTNLD